MSKKEKNLPYSFPITATHAIGVKVLNSDLDIYNLGFSAVSVKMACKTGQSLNGWTFKGQAMAGVKYSDKAVEIPNPAPEIKPSKIAGDLELPDFEEEAAPEVVVTAPRRRRR